MRDLSGSGYVRSLTQRLRMPMVMTDWQEVG